MKLHLALSLPLVLSFAQSSIAASFLSGGHIDGPAFGYDSGDGFEPHFHNEGGADGAIIDGLRITAEGEYEPDELIILVNPSSTTSIGATNYYWLPETEAVASANNVPFMGIGLEELVPSDWVGDLTISLASISGPGEFRLWQDDGFGGAIDFINTDGGSSSFTRAADTHTHFNWGFTELGTYELEWEISGTHQADGAQSGSAVYTYAVPEPSSSLLVLGAATLLGLRRRR